MKTNQILEDLNSFTGTVNYYKAGLGIHYTDGVKHLADVCKSYWLIDMIVSWQVDKRVRKEEFQVCRLAVENQIAVFTIEDGNGNIVAVQEIAYTDFPLPNIEILYSNKIIYLPSEH